MFLETGFAKDAEDEYQSRACVHIDCFRWAKRDSFLRQGSQGLKAVITAKLGYNPIELDPELMTRTRECSSQYIFIRAFVDAYVHFV